MNKQTFSIRDQPCVKVVVFTDRAEVQRTLKTKLKLGENELTITAISNSIDRDSVRVEGRGAASVLDVVCQDKHVQSENLDNISAREKELKSELQDLEAKRDILNQKLERTQKQIGVLNEFANSLSKGSGGGGGGGADGKTVAVLATASSEKVNAFIEFLDTYAAKLEKLDSEKLAFDKELRKLSEQIQVINDNLYKLVSSSYNQTVEITVLAEAEKDDTEVEFLISYVVFSASWIPKYDIRVFNKDKSMVINYFGIITQSTGEDWTETKLSLSTAVPSVGGNVPELNTQNVQIKVPIRPPVMYKNMKMGGSMGFKSARLQSADSDMLSEAYDLRAPMAMAAMPEMTYQTTEVQTGSIGSTSTFDIPRNATIPSDNTTHKVTIGIVSLKPEFEYETVPKKNTYAYIKAKVANTSEYPLLAGAANVFLDNNFVAKTNLKSYSPLEEFTIGLGVDPAIRIDYKPVKKFNSQSGGLLSQKTSTQSFHQVIEVKNTSGFVAKLLLVESLPLSNDDKIHVKLLEPNLKTAANVKLNKANNIEFELSLAPNKTEEIQIKYTIDYPADKEIEFV